MQQAQTLEENELDYPLYLNQPRKICIVEDDLDLEVVITQITKHIDPDLSIDWFTTAEDAVEHLRKMRSPWSKSPYELVIADIFLDGAADGLDLWRYCERTLPEMPILITSSLEVEKYFSSVPKNSLVPPFLPKPFSTRECYEAISGLLHNRQ